MTPNRYCALGLFLLSAACSPVDGSLAPLDGSGDPVEDGPPQIAGGNPSLVELPVTVASTSGAFMVVVVRPAPSGIDQILSVAQVVDGGAVLRLPGALGSAAGEWKVAVRAVDGMGNLGSYVDVSVPSLVFNPTATREIEAGWWVRAPGDAGFLDLSDGLTVGDRLLTAEVGVMQGEIDVAVDAYDFSVGFVATMPGMEYSITTDNFTIDETLFALGVEGAPVAHASGRTSAVATYWPMAYVDSDGEVGFDSRTDQLVGQTCVDGKRVGFGWTAPPSTLTQANALIRAHAHPGWTPVREGELGPRPLLPNSPVRFEAACGE